MPVGGRESFLLENTSRVPILICLSSHFFTPPSDSRFDGTWQLIGPQLTELVIKLT